MSDDLKEAISLLEDFMAANVIEDGPISKTRAFLERKEADGMSPEIEVTPEMIEAGAAALLEYDLALVAEGWDSRGDVVRAILTAALRAAGGTR